MKMITVESTTLPSVGYSAEHQILQIEFQNRSIYQYFDVPAATWEALLRAPSKGAYFNQSIRQHFAHALIKTTFLS